MTREYVLRLPWPKPPLSLNDRHPNHYAERRAQTAAHDAVTLVARSAAARGDAHRFERATVELVYYPANNARRDADNMAATLKPVLDGLVSAGLLEDDKSDHVLRTSQRIVLRQDDPDGRREPAVYLVVQEVRDGSGFRHISPHEGVR